MIKIPLDPGIVFDMLSILLLKSVRYSSIQNTQNYHSFVSLIKEQIGLEKLYKVLNSDEFKNLRRQNELIFDLVAKAGKNDCLASDVDRANYQRFLAKKALQEAHFDEQLSEQKIGYEN